jgi:non-specific serine/threonine protein kinase
VAVRVNAFTFASFLANFLGHASAPLTYARNAVALAEAASDEDPSLRAFALAGLVAAAHSAGDYQGALALAQQSIQLYRGSAWSSVHLGMALMVQGGLALELGLYDTARAALEESLALAREVRDAFRTAYILKSFGDLACCEQRYAEAHAAYEQAIALLDDLGARHDSAVPLYNMGHACLHLGDGARAHTLFSESLAIHQRQQNAPGMAECLIGFAALAVVRGLPGAGARLLAAAGGLGVQHAKSSWAVTRGEYNHYLTLARAGLTEDAFQAEQAAGGELSLEQAIAYARGLPLTAPARPDSGETANPLTGREREVATLIALGRSNSEIASELVVSKRTVEKHIANILAKLDLTSRAQLVRWAIGHGLAEASAC